MSLYAVPGFSSQELDRMGFGRIQADFASQHAGRSSCVIVANAPDAEEALDNYFKPTRSEIIIALDGAFHLLLKRGIRPDYVLGDLDSISLGVHSAQGAQFFLGASEPTYFVPTVDQDYTDLEKGLAFAYCRGATSIDVVNVMGGFIDHCLGAVGVICNRYHPRVPVTFWHNGHSIRFVRGPAHLHTRCRVGETWSALGAPHGKIVYTSGLQWDVGGRSRHPNGLKLSFLTGSLRNVVCQPMVKVVVEGSLLLIEPQVGKGWLLGR